MATLGGGVLGMWSVSNEGSQIQEFIYRHRYIY